MSKVISLQSFRARRSANARASLTRRGFPVELLDVDLQLAEAERALYDARQWLKRSRSAAGRARAIAECEEATLEVVRLEAVRLRITGAELALLKGGLDG